jgi:23S rRNA pseudouridine2605 synthase
VERLQKILARAGFGSRRASEVLLREGRVFVNGKPARLGESADAERDKITVDGIRVRGGSAPSYIALNKPVGVVSTNRAQDGRPTVVDLVASPRRLFPVGRLDADSEGLILLTDDGDLAQVLSHPRYGHEKEYRVQLDRAPDERQLEAWRRGVVLDDGRRTAHAVVHREGKGDNAWIRVVLTEGRKRQVRRTAEALGLRVRRLIRVRFGPLRLGDLAPGEWRAVPATTFRSLRPAPPADREKA